jgi:hypothetical protein
VLLYSALQYNNFIFSQYTSATAGRHAETQDLSLHKNLKKENKSCTQKFISSDKQTVYMAHTWTNAAVTSVAQGQTRCNAVTSRRVKCA